MSKSNATTKTAAKSASKKAATHAVDMNTLKVVKMPAKKAAAKKAVKQLPGKPANPKAAAKKAPAKKAPSKPAVKVGTYAEMQANRSATSSVENPVHAMWDLCDSMTESRRKDVIAKAVSIGINYYTARTQYQLWLTAYRNSNG